MLTLKEKIILMFHPGKLFRNYSRLIEYAERADEIIRNQGEKIQTLELEHEYFAETDKLFHHCEEQRKQIKQLNLVIKYRKDRIKLLEKSNAFQQIEIEKLNKQILDLNQKLAQYENN